MRDIRYCKKYSKAQDGWRSMSRSRASQPEGRAVFHYTFLRNISAGRVALEILRAPLSADSHRNHVVRGTLLPVVRRQRSAKVNVRAKDGSAATQGGLPSRRPLFPRARVKTLRNFERGRCNPAKKGPDGTNRKFSNPTKKEYK